MTYRLRRHTQHNHPALERDKFRLNTHERATPAAEQLGDTVHAAHEDGHIGDDHSADEEAEAARGPDGECRGRELVASLVGSETVFCDEDAENDEDYK